MATSTLKTVGPFVNEPITDYKKPENIKGMRDAIALIGQSARTAGRRLQFYRFAYGTTASGLPGTYKLGFWYDSAPFPDQRFDSTGLPLADPSSTGIALMRRNNFSLYGVMDQVIWQPGADSPRSICACTPDRRTANPAVFKYRMQPSACSV